MEGRQEKVRMGRKRRQMRKEKGIGKIKEKEEVEKGKERREGRVR